MRGPKLIVLLRWRGLGDCRRPDSAVLLCWAGFSRLVEAKISCVVGLRGVLEIAWGQIYLCSCAGRGFSRLFQDLVVLGRALCSKPELVVLLRRARFGCCVWPGLGGVSVTTKQRCCSAGRGIQGDLRPKVHCSTMRIFHRVGASHWVGTSHATGAVHWMGATHGIGASPWDRRTPIGRHNSSDRPSPFGRRNSMRSA